MNCKTSKLRDAINFALIAGVTTVAGTGVAFAQEDDSDTQSATSLDTITVTGSRIKRADIEGALPVTVIDRAMLENSGEVSVADYLRDTTFNSFGSYQSTSGSTGGGASTISLRGLGEARTLILIDGRRAPTSPMLGQGQNLNAIPLAAVERIEILTDGASAIYGSDALGGVVNIITRKDYDGMEVTYGQGFPTEAGGDTEEFSVLMGASGDRSRVLAGASYSNRDIIFARDRDYLANPPGGSVYSNNFATAPNTATGVRLRHPTFGAAVPGDCTAGTNLFYTTGSGTSTTCQYEHTAIAANLTQLENTSLFARADYQINDDWMVYTTADIGRVQSFGRYAPVPSSPWPGGAIQIPVGSPNHPGTIGGNNPLASDPYYQSVAATPLYLFHRFAALGPRDGRTDNNTYNILLGFEGRVGNVDLDFGARYSDSTAYSLGTNYVVAGLGQAPITSGAYNIYDPFAVDPGDLGITATITRDMKTTLREIYASASTELFSLPGGMAQGVIGAEVRDDYYQDIYDPLSSSGQIVGSAGNSAFGGRDVTSGYFELLLPFFTGFEVNVAGRYDQYSDYGDDFSPKVSMRWQPLDALTLRASIGEGFRAPTLDILTQQTTFSATATTDPQTCQLLTNSPNCQTQVTTYSIANPNLESEQSEQWSAGIVWDATDWLNMSLDYYNIEITNQIASTTLATVVRCLRGLPGLCPTGLTTFPAGTVLPNEALGVGAQFDAATGGIVNAQTGYVNLGFLENDGFDFVARTNFDMGEWGSLRNMLSVAYVRNYSSNGNANVIDEAGYPQMRATLNNNWTLGDWAVNWNISHIDSTKSDFSDDYRLPSWTIHNVQLSYTAPWNATVTLGVNNVANKDPVFDPAYGGSAYDYYLYDPWGRVPYFRYTQRF